MLRYMLDRFLPCGRGTRNSAVIQALHGSPLLAGLAGVLQPEWGSVPASPAPPASQNGATFRVALPQAMLAADQPQTQQLEPVGAVATPARGAHRPARCALPTADPSSSPVHPGQRLPDG
jgi:hypothetical protein